MAIATLAVATALAVVSAAARGPCQTTGGVLLALAAAASCAHTIIRVDDASAVERVCVSACTWTLLCAARDAGRVALSRSAAFDGVRDPYSLRVVAAVDKAASHLACACAMLVAGLAAAELTALGAAASSADCALVFVACAAARVNRPVHGFRVGPENGIVSLLFLAVASAPPSYLSAEGPTWLWPLSAVVSVAMLCRAAQTGWLFVNSIRGKMEDNSVVDASLLATLFAAMCSSPWREAPLSALAGCVASFVVVFVFVDDYPMKSAMHDMSRRARLRRA